MRNVYVVTHAQSLHHVEERVGGWYDTSLTDLGREQAEKTGRFLRSAVDSTDVRLFSSDLKRAAETAEIIGRHLQRPATPDSRLREMSYGDAEGKPQSWFRDQIKPQPSDGNRLDHRVYAGAESRREVAERVGAALTDILEMGALDTVIVSHGFASTFLIMAWMKAPAEHMDYCSLPARPGSVTRLHEDDLFGNRSVIYLCRTTHLEN
ncbi:MAG: histidine phosphatase family protein [Candidatus Bathyarchaeota archaeon]|nr:MAG: histidine phosphatase family protein [Candidatus Bathyarchaeota archaeon]